MAVADELNRIIGAKAAIKAAIENKGVAVNDVLINEYAGLVNSIPAGNPPVSGNAPSGTGAGTPISTIELGDISTSVALVTDGITILDFNYNLRLVAYSLNRMAEDAGYEWPGNNQLGGIALVDYGGEKFWIWDYSGWKPSVSFMYADEGDFMRYVSWDKDAKRITLTPQDAATSVYGGAVFDGKIGVA
jgi:hypothetical protein